LTLWNRCVEVGGDYVEKFPFCIFKINALFYFKMSFTFWLTLIYICSSLPSIVVLIVFVILIYSAVTLLEPMSIKDDAEAHTASYPMGTRVSFPGDKVDGSWSWQLTFIQYRGQRISGAILPLPQYALMAWCSVKKNTGTEV